MQKIINLLGFVFALFMVFAGVQHFLKPENYLPFVPFFLPLAIPIIYLTGVLEITFGIAYLAPKYRYVGAWGIFILMLIFLPVHIIDIFVATPAIGSKMAAYIRLGVQFLFLALTWHMIKTNKKTV